MTAASLTPKQRRFVDEYLIDLNATQAAIRAGYSQNTAEQQGYQLLHHSSVAAAVASAQQDRSERVALDAEMVVGGLLQEARRDGDGSSHAARVSAWTTLAKHLGMLKERHEHSGPDGAPIQTKELTDRDRAKAIAMILSRGMCQETSRKTDDAPQSEETR
jgi:phage terminase small subunit